MMRKLLLAIATTLWATSALAQAVMCPNQPNGTSNNTCANTRFVIQNAGGGGSTPGGSNGDIQYNNAGAFGGLPQVTVPKGGTGVASFTANLPILGNGAGNLTQGTRSGNTTVFGTTTGALTNNHCAKFDASGNITDSGVACTSATTLGTCDVINITGNTSITSGTAALTVAGANFQVADIGKVIAIPGAGAQVAAVPGTLVAIIASRTSTTQVGLDRNAGTTLAAVSKTVTYGTDDTAAFQTALSDATTGSVSFAAATGCMITDQLALGVAKTFSASPTRSKLYYRQLAGTTFKPMLSVSVDGLYLKDFYVDADPGGVVTSATKNALIDIANKSIRVENLTLYGNRDILNQPIMGGLGSIGSNLFIINNTISNFATFPIQGGCGGQSRILISGNRISAGPKLSNGNGLISFLCSGTSAVQGDIRVFANSIDMSDLSVADMNVGIYFFGNTTPAYNYSHIAVSDNVIIGAPGATASTTGGVILINAQYATITGNIIKYTGECIGSGASRSTITGNTLIGCGTYGIEASGTGVIINGNLIDAENQSPFGMAVGNCNFCTINNNSLIASNAPNNYRGIYIYSTSGNNSNGNTLSNNNIITSTQSGISGIYYDCQAGSPQCANNNIVGNQVQGGAASSYGIRVESVATISTGWLVGPNTTSQAVGISVAVGAGLLCYVAGMNRSTTKTAGGAFPGSCT